MSVGPSRDGHLTFQRLNDNPRWAGIWDVGEAGPYAIRSYLRTYGPATRDSVHRWLGDGLGAGRKRLDAWLTDLSDELAAVDVEGTTAHVLRGDLDDLMAARPTQAVRLLPGHDQSVMGPSTRDEHVVPPAPPDTGHPEANLVVAGGLVSGTWSARGAQVDVRWFGERGDPPGQALHGEV